jgi:hypothetical protein
MKMARSLTGWCAALLAVAVLVGTAGQAEAQSVRDNDREKTKMPSTLRYGSGYLDVPSAMVLPHLAITGTYSGWVLNLAGDPNDGNLYGDGSVALGLFDWVEIGGTFQSFNDSDAGGTMAGAFGRIALLRPQRQGIGLAVGARYVSEPSFDDDKSTQPTRYGAPHQQLFDGADGNSVSTAFSPYVVATADVAGLDIGLEHDYTFTLGWGSGVWRDGRQLDFYSNASSSGFFAGAGVHMGLGTNTLLNLMGEWNGFDVNVGAQLDFSGIRVGGFVLGSNYLENKTVPRSAKWGFLVSAALCPDQGGLCKPGLLEKASPDTVRLPAPPPDTVRMNVEVAPPPPTGTPATLCLATGENAQVLVTAQGDTLVGDDRVSVRTLRPGVVFAGTYAEGMSFFENDEDITFEDGGYSKSGGEVGMNCGNIMRVGDYMGVPLFADSNASSPYETVYVPVRPGVWQGYQTGLQSTRGQ